LETSAVNKINIFADKILFMETSRVMRWVDYKTDQMVRSRVTFSVCKTHKTTKAKLPSTLKNSLMPVYSGHPCEKTPDEKSCFVKSG